MSRSGFDEPWWDAEFLLGNERWTLDWPLLDDYWIITGWLLDDDDYYCCYYSYLFLIMMMMMMITITVHIFFQSVESMFHATRYWSRFARTTPTVRPDTPGGQASPFLAARAPFLKATAMCFFGSGWILWKFLGTQIAIQWMNMDERWDEDGPHPVVQWVGLSIKSWD